MKYIYTKVSNQTGNLSDPYGNEGFFLFQILNTLKNIFGDRINFKESTAYFNNGGGAFPTNAEIDANENEEQSKVQNYTCDIIIDSRWALTLTIRFNISNNTYTNYTNSRNSITLNNVILNLNKDVSYNNNGSSYKASVFRRIYIKIIEQQNILLISFQNYNKNSVVNISILKNTNSYSLNLTNLSPAAANINAYPQLFFLVNNTYTEMTYDKTENATTTTGNILKLNNRFYYNYNVNNDNKVEIAQGKLALINNATAGISNTVFTVYSNLYDCSYLPSNLFYTINDEKYYALNNYTLVKVNNGLQQVNTLIQQTTSSTPSQPEPEGE